MAFPQLALSEGSNVRVEDKIVVDKAGKGTPWTRRFTRRPVYHFELVSDLQLRAKVDEMLAHFELVGNAYFDFVWLDNRTYSCKYKETPQDTPTKGEYHTINVELTGPLA